MWTLEYNGQEKALAEWGFAGNLSRTLRNMAPDVVSGWVPGRMDLPAVFGYGGAVIIRRGRSGAGPYSGGAIWFQGRAQLPERSGSGSAEGVTYRFAGPWWDFERLVMQQQWRYYDGDPEDLAVGYTSEVFLGQTAGGAKQHTGAQIAEAVDWAISCGAACQRGVIDPAADIPTYNARDITVAEVITQMVRWTPDVVCWFDYGTSPPTFHARRAANLGGIETGMFSGLQDLSLTPRHDLVLPAVVLRYKQTNVVDGAPWTVFGEDKWPLAATGREIGASVHTVELQGGQQTNLRAEIVTRPVAAQGGAAARLAWWREKEPLLKSGLMENVEVGMATVTDADGVVSLEAYPYELVDGTIAPWMLVSGNAAGQREVEVRATARYDLYADGAHKLEIKKGMAHELSARIRLTNAPSGAYSTIGSLEEGEAAPVGLARAIYEAHATLQHEGRVTVVQEEVDSGLGMGKVLTVDTGSEIYSGMLVQQVTEDVGTGRVTLEVGPAVHLGLADLIELLRVNRYRLTLTNPATRVTARRGGDLALGAHVPRENTTGLAARAEVTAVVAADGPNYAVVAADAKAKTLSIRSRTAEGATPDGSLLAEIGALGVQVTPVGTDGEPKSDVAAVRLLLADLPAGKVAKFREFHYRDAAACKEYKTWIAMTEPEEVV